MALEMQQQVTQFSAKYDEPFTIRIGINTGPVVAGVIGKKKLSMIYGGMRLILPAAWNPTEFLEGFKSVLQPMSIYGISISLKSEA